MLVIMSKEDYCKLSTSHMYFEGTWEEGVVYDSDLFFLLSLEEFCDKGDYCPTMTHLVCPNMAEGLDRFFIKAVVPGSWERGYRLNDDAKMMSGWHNWEYCSIGASCSLESFDDIPF